MATLTAAQRQTQAEAVTAAFLVAMNRIGAGTLAESLVSWEQDVPLAGAAGAGARWLTRRVRSVMAQRRRAHRLAVAYYRLIRALRTGRTVGPEDGTTTLGELRGDFARLAGPLPDRLRAGAGLNPGAPGGSDVIPVERLDGWESDDERQERDAEDEAREALTNLGLRNLRWKLRDVDRDSPAEKRDADREEAHRKAGRRQAAASERIALNGGRGKVWDLAGKDKRVLGYIRVSQTGTPCSWCAMLISRGPVYRSRESGSVLSAGSRSVRKGTYEEGDLYHDNCKCTVEPVYSREQYKEGSLYALNREYEELWPKVTKGLSGKAARRAWRRFFYTQERARAQAAAQTQLAQEA
ncbi:hypothetical protein [Plantactinospora sp. WMMB782]|uniref:VG15 protein n=1 Tax=Plantactinospora sp. WMMB782 TaxID=3404121 RepID=UPI003B927947